MRTIITKNKSEKLIDVKPIYMYIYIHNYKYFYSKLIKSYTNHYYRVVLKFEFHTNIT